MFAWPTPVTYVNARVVTPEGEASSMRVRRSVLGLDERPRRGDVVVDLDGRFVLPGLINSHDHLELNHYGALKCRERYGNASEWIADLAPVIQQSAEIRAKSRVPLQHRLFIGGLKNLMGGVTTVAHHNPLYRAFGRPFPVRVVKRYGWAHSLSLEHGPAGAHGEPGGIVAQRCASTPVDAPFIVHAAEGVDDHASREVDTLEEQGSLRPNTVLVHGLAIATARWHELFGRGVSLVWCPVSNCFLFGRTLRMPDVLASPLAESRVTLGTDSRVTGGDDLLDELRAAAAASVPAESLIRMVTSSAAQILRLRDAGRIGVGATADFIAIPARGATAAESLLRCSRRDVSLVVRSGMALLAEPALRGALSARRQDVHCIEIDGATRLMDGTIGRQLAACPIAEPGVRWLSAA